MLQKKSKELEIPLITYAEDACMMGGFHLLMYGDTKLVHKTAMIGRIGYLRKHMQMQKFAADYDVQIELIHKGENKVRFNPFKETKQ